MLSDGQELIEKLELPGYGLDEVGFMEETVIWCKPSFIADWGTNLGSSARIFWELSYLHGLFPQIVTVDLPLALAALDRDHAGGRTGILSKEKTIIHLTGDGVIEALTRYVHYGRPEKALFFVDGDHSLHNVVRELNMIERLAPTAMILLHDTRSEPGLAVEQFIGADRDTVYVCEFLGSQAGMTRLTPASIQVA